MQAFVKLLTIYDFDIKIANVVVVGGGGKVISRCNLFLSNKNLHCSKWVIAVMEQSSEPRSTLLLVILLRKEKNLYKRVLMNQHQSKSSKPTGAL